MSLIKAVSYSRIQAWRWCPATLRYKVVQGLKEPPSPAMDRGNDAHKLLERYVAAKGRRPPRLPKEYEHLKAELSEVRGCAVRAVEAQYAFDKDWEKAEYFAPEVRWRMKIDLWQQFGNDVWRLTDYKTGKIRPEKDEEQLELYALTSLLVADSPPAQLETALWYVDHEERPRVMHVYEDPNEKLIKKLKRYWEREGDKVLNDDRLAPTPNAFKCGRCHFSSKRGGPCQAAAA